MTDQVLLMPGQWSAEQAAEWVRESYEKTVEQVIETGRRLIEAKQSLPHGQWLPMVELLPFSEQTARKFMQIADHDAISNRAHGRDLPASWRTLAVLAQLPPAEVEERIRAGQITPDTTRRQAEEWALIHQAAKDERHSVYNEIVTGLKQALSASQTFDTFPDDLPASRTQPAELLAWARKLTGVLEGMA